ncbi:hypothetical protein N7539_002668 [Penicillium diatomitis]|uniref:Uncharacterized protein n=1 Tax=Penicillium diatomitis TaxID=2819901 RepID=A0A9W9XFD8_9EURO|nr:uncharacterized protein N7539_002668 [Penicillium diatomitis]KAJ5491101.1 hypothetical protein N7539_002668 [Penicillium diatomitis]
MATTDSGDWPGRIDQQQQQQQQQQQVQQVETTVAGRHYPVHSVVEMGAFLAESPSEVNRRSRTVENVGEVAESSRGEVVGRQRAR